LSQLVGQVQDLRVAFGQQRPGAMVTAVFGGELAQPGALLGGDHKGAGGAVLAPRDDPGGVELAAGAAAVGFAAPALLQIEGARGQGLVAQEVAEDTAGGVMGTPELLAEFGDVVGHLHVVYYTACRYASKKKRKSQKPEKKGVEVAATSEKAAWSRF
jgi:hypothetical protein